MVRCARDAIITQIHDSVRFGETRYEFVRHILRTAALSRGRRTPTGTLYAATLARLCFSSMLAVVGMALDPHRADAMPIRPAHMAVVATGAAPEVIIQEATCRMG